ncbi:DUF308 domain-containing protein [Candidatus Saccharibacteria bacterium]|nr:DUF308 domain-containing protein [Candidatus Saccharibacteria bacterium]
MEKISPKSEKVITSIALLFIGISFIIWADKITDWLATLFGILALIYAFIKTIKYAKANPVERTALPLFYIIISATVGITLVSHADFIKEVISFAIGIYIIMTCSVQLLGISKLHRTKSLIWPIIGIIVGILCITGRFIVPNEIARLIGIALIIYAIVYLTGVATIESAVKKSNKKGEYKKIEEAIIIKEAKTIKHEKSSTRKEK